VIPKARTAIGDVEWHDYYASADPVPNGPLSGEDGGMPASSTEVFNRGSLVSDHTTYFANVEGFLAGAAVRLGTVVGVDFGGLRPGDWSALVRGGNRRRWRVTCLSVARAAAMAMAVALPLLVWPRLPATLEPLPARLETLLEPVTRALLALLDAAAIRPETVATARPTWALGLVAAVVASYAAALVLWRLWDRHDQRDYFERRYFEPAPRAAWLFAFWCVAWIEAGLSWAAEPASDLAMASFIASAVAAGVGVAVAVPRHNGELTASFLQTALAVAAWTWLIVFPAAPSLLAWSQADTARRAAVVAYLGVATLASLWAFGSERVRRGFEKRTAARD
jgi:hypothetical protein